VRVKALIEAGVDTYAHTTQFNSKSLTHTPA